MGAFLHIYDVRYPDILVESKFYIVNHHLPGDPDKFVGTVTNSAIVWALFKEVRNQIFDADLI